MIRIACFAVICLLLALPAGAGTLGPSEMAGGSAFMPLAGSYGVGGTVLFDDGAVNGYYNAFLIDGPNPGPYNQSISDGFVAAASGTADNMDVGLWVPSGSTPTALSWWLGTSAFAGDLGSGSVAQVDYTFANSNSYGYDIYVAHVGGLSGALTAGQTYWLTLGNANDSYGDQTVGWDVNGGPATCNFMKGGVNYGACGDSGEAFVIRAAGSTGTPEPNSLALLGSGILLLGGFLRRRLR